MIQRPARRQRVSKEMNVATARLLYYSNNACSYVHCQHRAGCVVRTPHLFYLKLVSTQITHFLILQSHCKVFLFVLLKSHRIIEFFFSDMYDSNLQKKKSFIIYFTLFSFKHLNKKWTYKTVLNLLLIFLSLHFCFSFQEKLKIWTYFEWFLDFRNLSCKQKGMCMTLCVNSVTVLCSGHRTSTGREIQFILYITNKLFWQ